MKPTINDKLMAFHRDLMKVLPKDQQYNTIVEQLDEIISDITGTTFRTCPFCHRPLINASEGHWVCDSIGDHGGQALSFIEGRRNCVHCSVNGPFCQLSGYCLWQIHGPLTHPVRCRGGRIDDQSPH